eukprot:GABV01012770.1.p1 GENE.GABV01012770.1~~GABV01012770.1.p1  ORF type:complete len:109 (-),score=30.65 GABV01012770.1:31-357(-)
MFFLYPAQLPEGCCVYPEATSQNLTVDGLRAKKWLLFDSSIPFKEPERVVEWTEKIWAVGERGAIRERFCPTLDDLDSAQAKFVAAVLLCCVTTDTETITVGFYIFQE